MAGSSSSCLPHLLSRLHLLRRRGVKNKPKGEEGPGQNWEDILLFHILPKLPVKSLFRFKCVCKNWLRWISHDPAFIREQSRWSLASPGFVHVSVGGGLEFLSTEGNSIDVPEPSLKFFKTASVFIEASCGGLLCVSVWKSDSTHAVFVGNPVTGEWSLIPSTKYFNRLALAFDPMDSLPTYQLMHPCLTRYDSDSVEYCFAVFSSATGVWTMSGAKFITNKIHMWNIRPVFKGGILYWRFDDSVVWFDLKKDLAGVLLLPGDDGLKHKDGIIGVWEGKLSYTRIVCEKLVEVWP